METKFRGLIYLFWLAMLLWTLWDLKHLALVQAERIYGNQKMISIGDLKKNGLVLIDIAGKEI